MKVPLPSDLKRLFAASIIIFATFLFAIAALPAPGQDQSAASTQDVIFARKSLMNTIEENTDRIGRMISDREIKLPEARARARNIFVMLKVLPHLFPANSNQ